MTRRAQHLFGLVGGLALLLSTPTFAEGGGDNSYGGEEEHRSA